MITDVEVRELQKDAIGWAHQISNDLDIPEVKVMIKRDGLLNQFFTVGLKTYIWGERLEGHQIDLDAKWPKDWREAFKERWFPKWLLVRCPVKYESKSVSVECTALYPNYKPALPDEQHVIRVARTKESLYVRGQNE